MQAKSEKIAIPLIGFIILCGLLLSGCGEVPNEYYISNHTDDVLTVTFTPRYREMVDLTSGPLIDEIGQSVRSSLKQSLDHDQVDESIQFAIPPKTTVFLGSSSGGNVLFSQLQVKSEHVDLSMDAADYRTYFSVHDNLVGAIAQVLDVR
ncbi:MAG: hypothetical protein GY759_04895 [Chloroflexi bacterium]|nr:hypothetical protein [Chloroflexota bacterium]